MHHNADKDIQKIVIMIEAVTLAHESTCTLASAYCWKCINDPLKINDVQDSIQNTNNKNKSDTVA